MAITPLPPAGLVTDDRATFSSKMFAWVAALVNWTTQANTLGDTVNTQAATVAANLASATAQAAAAAASAAAAQALVNAVAFNGATAYAQYQAAISTVNLLTYRRKTAGTSATDPSADAANWVNTGLPPVVVVRTAVNTTMLPGVRYVITAGGITMTLQAAPAGQDLYHYRTAPSVGGTPWTLAPGGANKIEGSTANFSVNVANARGTLWFDGTDGYIHLTT
jgi:hypothetical protein